MPPKEPTLKLTISAASFNEIAAALEKEGLKLDVNVGTLTLERGTKLEQPIDYRLATIRKDAAIVASRAYRGTDNFVDFVDEIYQYIIMGKKTELPTATNLAQSIKEWK